MTGYNCQEPINAFKKDNPEYIIIHVLSQFESDWVNEYHNRIWYKLSNYMYDELSSELIVEPDWLYRAVFNDPHCGWIEFIAIHKLAPIKLLNKADDILRNLDD